jgi:hypothetical protein
LPVPKILAAKIPKILAGSMRVDMRQGERAEENDREIASALLGLSAERAPSVRR